MHDIDKTGGKRNGSFVLEFAAFLMVGLLYAIYASAEYSEDKFSSLEKFLIGIVFIGMAIHFRARRKSRTVAAGKATSLRLFEAAFVIAAAANVLWDRPAMRLIGSDQAPYFLVPAVTFLVAVIVCFHRETLELKARLGFSENVLNNLPLPATILDKNCRIFWVNQHSCDMLERKGLPLSYVGTPCGEFILGDATSIPSSNGRFCTTRRSQRRPT